MKLKTSSIRGLQHLWQLLILLMSTLLPAWSHAVELPLRGGWYPQEPYQYEVIKDDEKKLTGLDIQLLRVIFSRMGYDLRHSPVAWAAHLEDLRAGTRDVAFGAFRTPQREEYAYFSDPYRIEKDVLYMRRDERRNFEFADAEDLIRILQAGPYKLGVIDGYFYGSALMAYIDDPRNSHKIVRASSVMENFNHLLEGKIDAFPADALVGATLTWRHDWKSRVFASPQVIFEQPVHVMFSKLTSSPQQVAQFNQTLAEMRSDGSYSKVMRDYLLPVLLGQTAGQTWFLVIDLIGTIAFAVSGVLLAREGRYSLLGALVLALMPSIGGGLMRDVLINRDVVSAADFPMYFGTVFATVMFFYVAFHATQWFPRLGSALSAPGRRFVDRLSMKGVIEFFDALGLSTCTVIGVLVAVETRVQPLWLWGPILAGLTGAGGAILRDVIRADANNAGLKESFYAEVSLIWGLALSLFLDWYSLRSDYDPVHLTAAIAVAIVGGLVTRLAVVYFKVRSPAF